jgi:hypothetical protein
MHVRGLSNFVTKQIAKMNAYLSETFMQGVQCMQSILRLKIYN